MSKRLQHVQNKLHRSFAQPLCPVMCQTPCVEMTCGSFRWRHCPERKQLLEWHQFTQRHQNNTCLTIFVGINPNKSKHTNSGGTLPKQKRTPAPSAPAWPHSRAPRASLPEQINASACLPGATKMVVSCARCRPCCSRKKPKPDILLLALTQLALFDCQKLVALIRGDHACFPQRGMPTHSLVYL